MLTQERYDRIIESLKHNTLEDEKERWSNDRYSLFTVLFFRFFVDRMCWKMYSHDDYIDRYLLESMNVGEVEEWRLRKKGSNKIVIPIEAYYNVIKKKHEDLGHAGRNILGKELHTIYANIGYREVMMFLEFCEQCQLKARKKKKGIITNPILENEFNCRCQVDLIDVQTRPDNDFKFILNYQDHFTKYLRLKPLKSKTVNEVAENLLEIFMDLGTPDILQSDNGG